MEVSRRILLVEGSGRGFLCHYAHALALGLHRLGHEVRLVSGERDELADWPAPFDKAACLGGGWSGWRCLAAQVREWRPEVVHFQWISQPVRAAVFARWLKRRGIAVVYTPHNVLPHRRRWLQTPGFRLFYRAVDMVVARDGQIAWGLSEMVDVAEERIVHLPGSPNLMALPGMPRRRAPELADKRAGETRLLYFGHGSARKGLAGLVDALDGLGAAGLHLVVAGEGVRAGADAGALARAAAAMRTTVIDRYVDPAEVADLFETADLLVMPYAKQCRSPLADLAAAFTLPVLRTDRVSTSRFVDDIHGLTVPHGDPRALRAGMAACLAEGRLAALRAALRREESVWASMSRVARGHARLYAGMPSGDPLRHTDEFVSEPRHA